MTLVSDLFANAQRIFGDESQVQMTQADVTSWVNAALREIAMQNDEVWPATLLTTSVSKQQRYTITNLFTKGQIQAVYYKPITGGAFYKLVWKSLYQFNELLDGWDGDTDSSDPIYYTREALDLVLFPAPSLAITNGIKIYRTGMYPTVASGDDLETVGVPDYYISSIEAYILLKAYEMDENYEAATMKAQEFQSDISSNLGRANKQGQQSFSSISSVND